MNVRLSEHVGLAPPLKDVHVSTEVTFKFNIARFSLRKRNKKTYIFQIEYTYGKGRIGPAYEVLQFMHKTLHTDVKLKVISFN
uniref:Uncharacterized protein n=1 Tax=Arundo donax TaxID=35708 RepID=A0A0A9DUM9_ARUDO